jgi:hypothetical protein
MTRESPYVRLRRIACRFASQIVNPIQCTMFVITPDNAVWQQIKERTVAAKQLRHEVLLSITDDGKILLSYRPVITPRDVPWEIRP